MSRGQTNGSGSGSGSGGGTSSSTNSPTRTAALRLADKHSRQLVTLCRQLTRCLFHENEVRPYGPSSLWPNTSYQYTLSTHPIQYN